MSSRCTVVRILKVGITGLTVLRGGGLGPAEEEKGLTAGELGLEDRVRQGPSSLSANEQIPSSPLSNEEPEKLEEMVMRPHKALRQKRNNNGYS